MPERGPTAVSDDAELAELLAEVRRIDVQSRRLVTAVLSGGYVSAFKGAGIEFEEVREYVEGDDPRAVDWNVTARMGRPFVKRFVDERERTVTFLLDLSASMTGGFGIWSARQTAARVCACLAMAAVHAGDKVGFTAFGSQVTAHVPAAKGASHALRVVRDCLALPPEAGRTDLVPALERATRTVRHGAVVFLVSDFLADGWTSALSACARRHDVVAVRIGLPELEPLARGLVRVRDPETSVETVVDASSARVRAAYEARVRAWRERTEVELRRAGVDLLDVPVPRAPGKDLVAGPILRFFRMRELRGAKR